MNVPETFFSVNEELRLFGLSCLFGAAFGVAYDLFRTVRLLLPHNGAMVAAEDIAFLALYGCSFRHLPRPPQRSSVLLRSRQYPWLCTVHCLSGPRSGSHEKDSRSAEKGHSCGYPILFGGLCIFTYKSKGQICGMFQNLQLIHLKK